MKTINDVKKEIGVIENLPKVEILEMKPVVWRRLKKKLELLRILVIYLETNPTEQFVLSEMKRLEKLISAKMKEFAKDELVEKGVSAKEITKLKNKHEAKYDLKKMRTHVRTLRLLIA